MGYVDPCTINKAREMDLLTYLQNYEPQELVSCGKGIFCTREHDSLKISNGKWFWFSRGIGGKSALDYLVNVKDVPFKTQGTVLCVETQGTVLCLPTKQPNN